MARKPTQRRPGASEVVPADPWDAAAAGDARLEADSKGYGGVPDPNAEDAEIVEDDPDAELQDPDVGDAPDGPGEMRDDGAIDMIRADEEAASAEEAEERRNRVRGILARLQIEADMRVGKRQSLEQRWIEDSLQFHGRYDEKTATSLKGTNNSKLFINKTRPITNGIAARLMDLLFPTDDRNWGLQPSPVPELVAANDAAQSKAVTAEIEAREASAAAQQDVNAAPAAAAAGIKASAFRMAADELAALVQEARDAADLMQAEIEDHLKACNYQAAARDVVDDACQIGTGVMKGPVTGQKATPRWVKMPNGQHMLAPQSTTRPSLIWIDPWSFFPDPDVAKIQDGEGVYIRHLLNKKAVRGLGRLPGFDKDALRRLLNATPRGSIPSYVNELRSINGEDAWTNGEVYQAWEYSGPLTPEEMRDLALTAGDEDTAREMDDVDPLDEVQAVIWFCQDELLSFAIYPLDSGEVNYSVFCLEKDRTSIFGFSVPYMLRDPQRALNAAWRLMMDNSSASAGSQIVVNKELIEPENGIWELSSRKIWILKSTIPANMRAFDAFDIPNHQVEYANIIALAKQNMEEEASLPAIAQGDQPESTTKTAGGMAMLMNASNVVFRRYVKNYDDDFTTPNIRRMYHHEMQHSKKAHIKGDFEVDARGSSVLLVREMQAQNLIVIADRFAAHPVFGKMLKAPDLLRSIVSAHMIAASALVKTDSEIEEATAAEQEAMAAAAGAGAKPGPDPEVEMRKLQLLEDELDVKVEISNQENATKRAVAKWDYDAKMAMLAEKVNETEFKGELTRSEGEAARRSKERTIEVEVASHAAMKRPPQIANT